MSDKMLLVFYFFSGTFVVCFAVFLLLAHCTIQSQIEEEEEEEREAEQGEERKEAREADDDSKQDEQEQKEEVKTDKPVMPETGSKVQNVQTAGNDVSVIKESSELVTDKKPKSSDSNNSSTDNKECETQGDGN